MNRIFHYSFKSILHFSLFTLPFLLHPSLLSAQTKQLSIEEATYMNPKLNASSLSQLMFTGSEGEYTWVAKNCLVKGTVKNPKADTVLRLDSLVRWTKDLLKEPLKRFPRITYLSPATFIFSTANKYILTDLSLKKSTLVNSCDETAENADFENQTYRLAYTKGNNLFISVNGIETAITSESNPGIVYGASRVHRNEWGIDKGTFWSPKGNFLAFYRMDETMVTDYPLVNINERIATVAPTKYPMAGMASHKVTVGVYDIKKNTTIYLTTNATIVQDSAKALVFLTNITWSPDEKYIFIAELNRDQNYMELNKYDAITGNLVKTLFTESGEKYVEPLNGPSFINPGKFIWQSQRDGFNHLYLYDTEGNLLKRLTEGPWVVTNLIGFDRDFAKVFFLSTKDSPVDRQLYSVDLKTYEMKKLTGVAGTHTTEISKDGKYILDRMNSITIPNTITLLDSRGNPVKVLLTAENPLKEYKLGETSLFTLKNKENQDLWCRLIKPAGFDPVKKYPVIIYVYGGPHSQLVNNTWLGGGGLYLNFLAEQGYVVFTLDNRGTSDRGRDFEQSIFRNLGTAEVEDQMCGVDYLTSLPWVDPARIGVHGWSYGGFMTISMLLKHPGVFKAAVAGGPVIDWKYYEVMYGERYMDTPQNNPNGYKNAALVNYVKDLSGKLLIIIGDQDGTVVPQNSLTFLKKCVDENKQVDFFIYPGHEHNVRGIDRVNLNQKIFNYFRENL
jgi:dipeptidyl-peptidase 4